MEISKYHKTRLSVSMRVLENTVYEMEELVRDSNGRKTMTETVNNLTQRERDMILKRIVEIKESINYIAEHLNLTRRKVEAKNLILGAMTVERVNLDEM
jgi:FixJ family two-component response regulator